MDIADLEQMIDTAVAIEAKEGYLAHYLAERAAANAVAFGDKQRAEALELFEGYLRSVPKLLAAASASSLGTPVEAIMAKVTRAAVAYWDEPEDLVPDALGVLGLLDDSYYSLRMLQLVSERLQAETGQALIADDLSALDAVVRDILGVDLTDVLDDLVILSLSNTPVDELIATLGEHAGLTLPSAETSFAGLSIAELVEARLGFTTRSVDDLADELVAILDSFAGKLAARREHGGAFEPGDAIVQAGTAALEQRLREAFGSEAHDLDLAVSSLIGAVLQCTLVDEAPEPALLERLVHFVLDGLS